MGRFSIKSLHSLLELQTHTKSTARPTSTFYPSKMGQKRKCTSLSWHEGSHHPASQGRQEAQARHLVASRGFSVRAPWWQTEQLPAYNECPHITNFFLPPPPNSFVISGLHCNHPLMIEPYWYSTNNNNILLNLVPQPGAGPAKVWLCMNYSRCCKLFIISWWSSKIDTLAMADAMTFVADSQPH